MFQLCVLQQICDAFYSRQSQSAKPTKQKQKPAQKRIIKFHGILFQSFCSYICAISLKKNIKQSAVERGFQLARRRKNENIKNISLAFSHHFSGKQYRKRAHKWVRNNHIRQMAPLRAAFMGDRIRQLAVAWLDCSAETPSRWQSVGHHLLTMSPDRPRRIPTRDLCHRRRVSARILICRMFHIQTNRLEVNYSPIRKNCTQFIFNRNQNFADSPKLRNKTQNPVRYNRNANAGATKKPTLSRTKAKSVAHDIVVVREANKKFGPDRDPDLQKLHVRISFRSTQLSHPVVESN